MPSRVYDGDEVDGYIAQLHDYIEQRHQELEQLRAENEELARRRDYAAPAVDETAERTLGRAMLQAQQLADRLVEEARSEAHGVVASARREADDLLAAAERDASTLTGSAQQNAAEIASSAERARAALLESARREAESLVTEARLRAEAIQTRARDEAAEQVARAKREREHMLTDAQRQADDIVFGARAETAANGNHTSVAHATVDLRAPASEPARETVLAPSNRAPSSTWTSPPAQEWGPPTNGAVAGSNGNPRPAEPVPPLTTLPVVWHDPAASASRIVAPPPTGAPVIPLNGAAPHPASGGGTAQARRRRFRR